LEDKLTRTARLDAITQKISDAADRLRPITAAINSGDESRIAESDRIRREIYDLYDQRDAVRAEERYGEP
jgi:hypothetical protein